jgi:mono/diheme cytochrome c family protein
MKQSDFFGWPVAIILATLWGSLAWSSETVETTYRRFCVQCHGSLGNGQGINQTAEALAVEPRNHANPQRMSALTDKEIKLAITDGGAAVNKSPLMPAFGNTLSALEIDELADYLRKLCSCSYIEQGDKNEDQPEEKHEHEVNHHN